MKQLQKFIRYADKITYRLNRVLHQLSIVLLAFIMFLTLVSVIARYMGSPILGTYELTRLGLALLIFFSLGYTQLKKEHISIDFIVERWSPKAQAIADSITFFLFTLLMLAAAYFMAKHGLRLFVSNDITSDLRLPLYIFAYLSALGLFFNALAYFVEFLKSLNKVVEYYVT